MAGNEQTIGKTRSYRRGKQVARYLGLVPREESSGNRRRRGYITKQGRSIVRFLLVEAALVTVRKLPDRRSKNVHLTMRRGRKTAKIAMVRKLAVRLYSMWRKGWDFFERIQQCAQEVLDPTDIVREAI